MGSMSKKLLNKTLRVYILLSLVILVISAPLFYFIAQKLFIDDADETLFLHQKEFLTNNLPFIKTTDIAQWNKFSRDVKIEQGSFSPKNDSIFYRFYLDTLANENEPYRVLLSPISITGKPYTFMARVNLIESADLITSIAVLFCLILGLLLFGLYFITRRLSVRMWLPFYSTLKQVEQFDLEKSVKPDFVSTDIEEFNRLNQSIYRMLDKNLAVYRDQKEFIENAAHELQTPLAAFQAKLDVLVQQIPFSDKLGEALSNLNEAIAQLKRINKNLLLLSRIDSYQYGASEQVSVSDIVRKQVTFLKDQAEEKNIAVQLDQTIPLVITANPSLLEIAISNLLLNALRYNQIDGKIEIRLHQNTLTISNTSPYNALNPAKLFQRFAPTESKDGYGLGLSIVKKICDLHGWTVKYEYERDMHVFRLSF
jgi:signal transduction histidine kinase